MYLKRLIALTLFAALAAMPTCVLRAQWVQVSGPFGGSQYFVEIGTNLFVGTPSGVFRSTDSGTSWREINSGLPKDPYVSGLTAIGNDLFVATYYGMYRSQDNGSSWIQLNRGLTDVEVVSFAVTGTNLFAGTWSKGIFRSTDSGVSWELVDTTAQVRPLVASGANIFAETYYGFMFSSDNGTTWNELNTIWTDYSVGIGISGATIFVAKVEDDIGSLFRSTDSGANWEEVGMGIINQQVTSMAVIGNILFATTNGGWLYRSTDNGSNWVENMDGLSGKKIYIIAANNSKLFGVSGDTIFRSTDNGNSWKVVNTGVNSNLVNALTVSGMNLYAGTAPGGIYRSTDNGTSWRYSGLSDTYVNALSANDDKIIAGADSGIFLTTDSGASWKKVDTLSTNAFANLGSISFAGTDGQGILLSSDNGSTWNECNNGMTNLEVNALAVNGTELLAGTRGGIFRSTDSGTSWLVVNNGLFETYITSLAALGSDLFASTYSGTVYRSTDKGMSWTILNTNVIWGQINVLYASGSDLFVGSTYGGIHLSTDNGATWNFVSTGMKDTFEIRAIAVKDGDLFAGATNSGSYGDGIWRSQLLDLLGQSAVLSAPTGEKDIYSYPNPFSQSTQISFTSESAGYADISVVNLLGEQVARIFSGELDAGQHNFTFNNSTALPDGAYECLIRMNGRVEKQPMVLLH